MISSVSEQYAYLEAQEGGVQEEHLLTRRTDVEVLGGHVHVAIDSAGCKHLLVPAETVRPDSGSAGVALVERVVHGSGGEVRYADLRCNSQRLSLVFERLVDDVLQRIGAGGDDPVQVCRNALDEWRALLRSTADSADRETIVGLVGELALLEELAHEAPAQALAAWRGPSRATHDFVNGGSEIEVKTTASVDGNFISVSNVDQLDPALVNDLHLAVVHLRENAAAPGLDDRIERLIGTGVPAQQLIEKVASAGYLFESELEIPDRYEVRSLRIWKVGDKFPGLRQTELGETRLRGLGRIRYELALDSAPPRLGDAVAEDFLRGWALS